MTVPILDDVIRRLMDKDADSVFAIEEIARERLRQIDQEGWSTEHDEAEHASGELMKAAMGYAQAASLPLEDARELRGHPPSYWPWAKEWWKPTSRHRNRIKAAALIVADIARHARASRR